MLFLLTFFVVFNKNLKFEIFFPFEIVVLNNYLTIIYIEDKLRIENSFF